MIPPDNRVQGFLGRYRIPRFASTGGVWAWRLEGRSGRGVAMGSVCVVGVQWGDEGKGKFIDYLARDADLVARWAGGSNAGHTILLPDGRKFVLHLVPGGVFQPGVRNLIGSGVVVDPGQLLAEIDALEAAGVRLAGALGVAERAHLVLPWHKALDRAREAGGGLFIGTTGRGIGPCYEDKAARRGVRLLDLGAPARLRERLDALARERNILLEAYGHAAIDPATVCAELLAQAGRLLPLAVDAGGEVRAALARGRRVLLEGAQGVLLDLDHGTYPFVTSSGASTGGVPSGIGIPPSAVDRVLGVVKAYTTRVGEGPFPTELHGPTAERLRSAGREFGATTGRPRRCGWFDGAAVRYAVELAGVTGLILTKLDVLAGLGELELAVGYEGLERFPADPDVLRGARPVLRGMQGWEQPLAGIDRFERLPAAARAYIEAVEKLAGVPVELISLGPGRDEVLRR